jgi:hypothetical protein
MSKRLFSIAGGLVLSLAVSGLALAQTTQTTTTTQTTVTQATQNSDGSWTVVEYPVGKEVVVNLTPTTVLPGAGGRARIHRMGDHTMVHLDLTGVTGDVSNLNLYAVEPTGRATLLGPLTVSNGTATFETATPLNRFMLMVSPEANLTTYAPNTRVLLRSAVPQGFAVVPLASSDREDGAAVGEKVSATTTAGATSGYNAPMLGISGMKRGEDVQMKINLAGALAGARANVDLLPRADGPTTVKMRFHELKDAPAGKVFVVWAVSPDNKFVKLGQIVNTGGRNEAEIRSETALPEFGLLITLEDEVSTPVGPVVGTVIR